jgi:hypothetical protein
VAARLRPFLLAGGLLKHDPEPKVSDSKKLQAFRVRSCEETKIWSSVTIQLEVILL